MEVAANVLNKQWKEVHKKRSSTLNVDRDQTAITKNQYVMKYYTGRRIYLYRFWVKTNAMRNEEWKFVDWNSGIKNREQGSNDVSNQQDATTFSFINLFKSTFHVSGD
jgi:hypothetical protein